MKYMFIFALTALCSRATAQVDHWETVVYDSMHWRYWVGTTDTGMGWQEPAFNDSAWPTGRGGLGYGDDDDRTIIQPALSVFIRKKFMITNRSDISEALLHVDYDDGFVAYLNGTEITRAMMPEGNVLHNQPSNGLHEALLYQGQSPEGYLIANDRLATLLVPGENTLAVQVHNDNVTSSDLSARVFFSVGIISSGPLTYLPVPEWFVAPTSFTSNLPIIAITTNGQEIQDEPRIVAHMGIIDNGPGQLNSITSAFTNYDGRISIETRGESSQMFPKKSYSIETQTTTGSNFNASLLGMPPENDWVLYAPYTDKTMMRDVLAFQLSRDLGNYAPRTRFLEVVINGVYEGVYVLMERIKRDDNRIDIAALQPNDLSGDELTGGYVLRVDKLDGNDYPGWLATPTPVLPGANDITFQYVDPAGEELMTAQRSYIQTYMQQFQSALTSTMFSNEQTGFKSYLDVSKTIDFILVNELGKNVDAFIFSTYLYKEKNSDGGKLVLGPLWDFNLAFGNVDYLPNAQFAPGWMWNDQYRMFWFRRMMQDPEFADRMQCRWTALRNGILSDNYFANKIDSIASALESAQQRNYDRWPILGTYVWPNQFVGATYEDELNFLKTWIANRLAWMDANMPGDCDVVTAVEDEMQARIFPNPFSESIRIEMADYTWNKLEVRDLTGRVVYRHHFLNQFVWEGNGENGNDLPDGLYTITVSNERGVLQERVVIRSMDR
jgi:hypothetical protein